AGNGVGGGVDRGRAVAEVDDDVLADVRLGVADEFLACVALVAAVGDFDYAERIGGGREIFKVAQVAAPHDSVGDWAMPLTPDHGCLSRHVARATLNLRADI